MDAPLTSFQNVFTKPIASVGGTPLTLAGILIALVIVIAAFRLSGLAVRLLARLRNRVSSGSAALYILERFVGYGVAFIGLLLALSSLSQSKHLRRYVNVFSARCHLLRPRDQNLLL
jgi:small-conductance mechanosensitive channel